MKRFLTLLSLLAVVMAAGACDGQAEDVSEQAENTAEEVAAEVEGAGDAVGEGAGEGAGQAGGIAGAGRGDAGVFDYEKVEASDPSLIIGQSREPASLYIYGGSMLAGTHVLNSIYDGPIEGLDYGFQAVILEELPRLENDGSGAYLTVTPTEEGERYLDPVTQEVMTATFALADLQQLTVRFKLRDGVTWQDGTPVTAHDSVFSQYLACHPDSPTSKVLCERTEHYVAIDDQTVEWKGLPGYTDQTYFTNFYTPLPRHQVGGGGLAMEEMEPADIIEDEEFKRRPYAYGPFMIKEWVADERIVLERNPHYWRADEGLPYLDEVIHRFVGEANTLLADLIDGDVDVATQDGLDITQFDALTAAEADGTIVPYYVSGTVWEHIDFNLQPTDERVPVGACQEIRHALILGTDRQAMVDEIQKGQTQVQHSFVPPEHWAYPIGDDLVEYPYDPDAAIVKLEALGFTDGNGDGVREAQEDITCTVTVNAAGETADQLIPAGTPLSLTLQTTSQNEMRRQTTERFQEYMNDIGVVIALEPVDDELFFDRSQEGPLTGRRYDLGQFAWLTGVQPPVALYFCERIPDETNGWTGHNNTGWCNPDYDRFAKQAETTLDRDEAVPLYGESQRIWATELPVMPLFARVKVMGTSPRVVNFSPNATVNSETWNIETWALRPAE